MPPRIPEEVRARVVHLLRLHQNASEVQRQLRSEENPVKVGLGQIIRVADAAQVALKSGRRSGHLPPGVPRGGRPKGPGKKTSRYRDKAREFRSMEPQPSFRAVAAMLTQHSAETDKEPRTFTGEGVRQLLLTDDDN